MKYNKLLVSISHSTIITAFIIAITLPQYSFARDFYLGIPYGNSSLNPNTPNTITDDDNSYGIILGTQVTNHINAEISYVDLGKMSYTKNNQNQYIDYQMATVGVNYYFSTINNQQKDGLFIGSGLRFAQSNYEVEDATHLYTTIGVDVPIDENIGVRLFNTQYSKDASLASLAFIIYW